MNTGSRRSARRRTLGIWLPVLVVILWEQMTRFELFGRGVIPSPWQVITGWYGWMFGTTTGSFDLYSGQWLTAVFYSTRRVVIGFLAATSIGVPLGILIGWSTAVRGLVDPTIQLLRPIPITAWIPFSVIILGIYEPSALFLIFLGAFYPIVVNTTHGVRDTGRNLIRAAQMLGASQREILVRVVLPSALPAIFTGLRLGVGIGWTALIAAEMIAVRSGLGYVLWDAYYVGRMELVIAAMLSVGLLGYVSDRLILAVDLRVLGWREGVTHHA